jgi:predicted O-methyltransferase YrrM
MPSTMIRRTLGYALDQLPYVSRLRRMLREAGALLREAGAFAPGHFYSPIPNHAEVLRRVESMRAKLSEVRDIRFNRQEQFDVLQRFAAFYADLPFPTYRSEGCRYYYDQSAFCYPDAIFLYSFLRETKPARIIEVGSGFSSAVMLDTIDRFFSKPPEVTFVEPNAGRLNQLLRDTDRRTVNVIEQQVQNVPIDVFRSLGAGDLLFIDSSHVLKCGSDLQFLLFEVLPELPVGIYVHFHDVFETFEYPEEWLLGGWYWNEAYFLRAFLTNNNAWEIYFFNNLVRNRFEEFLTEKMPLCLKDIGGSLYIRRVTG